MKRAQAAKIGLFVSAFLLVSMTVLTQFFHEALDRSAALVNLLFIIAFLLLIVLPISISKLASSYFQKRK